MKRSRTLLSVLAVCALAFSFSAFAAIDPFKPSGIAVPGIEQVAAKIGPGSAGAVANSKAAVVRVIAFHAYTAPAIARERTWGKAASASPETTLLYSRQIGMSAEREGSIRHPGLLQV